ncbi:CubicO group peptidase (beta-lactamase class C family) [Crossiella equi]|uniref:CubicO group peptidase (Beta-lactamase class C family) n=1 Tax=Crossiella equi TaxID=130796 RepID=A0ABS5AQF9_9PSEU|nr:serine hydrolase domain-containing protein [Crossiella equi]MBP2478804.1 CubicO group peptidase (beta-lactamase class C family) [Crossiella equi]
MTRIDEVRTWLRENLPALAEKHGVPGAQAAVLVDGEVADAAAGLLSTRTGVEATTDALFQVGSVTKLWTATLVLQLVDEGLLDLDAPVRAHVPDAPDVTTRQLLNHTGGFEGDLFFDTGRGEDAIAKLVARLGEARPLFPAGERFSYNNAGYVVLGRLVEVLRDKPFAQVLRERLITPLGLAHTASGAEEAILFRAAVGHLPGPGGPVAAPVWSIAASNAPAGSQLAMRAADLLEFARLYLDGGREGVLSAEAVAALHAAEVELPYLARMPTHYGLGWGRWELGEHVVVGHDGGTIGQSAFLRLVPAAGVAVALLTNGGATAALYQDVVVHLVRELTGVELPAAPELPEAPVRIDPARVVGRYDTVMARFEVTVDEQDRLWLRTTPLTEEARQLMPADAPPVELVALREDVLLTRERTAGTHMAYAVIGEPGQPARFLHNSRALPRS